MIVIERRLLVIHRLRAAGGPDVFDGAALLILLRPPKLQVVFIGKPGGAHVRRYVALILRQRPAQAFAINQLFVELAVHQRR